MSKLFFDVFPDLKVPSEMEKLMTEVEVTKVSSNRQRDRLRVYLLSSRLIGKSNIYRLESDIRKQLFPNHELSIKIIEKFRLSGQYSPRTLMEVYRESILEEFRAYSLLEYNVLRMAQTEFPEEQRMRLIFEDSVIARQKSEEIVEILEKIICERCGLSVDIQVDYREPKENRHLKNSDIQIQNEVKNILRHAASESASASRSPDGDIPEDIPNPKQKPGGPAPEKQSAGKKKEGFSGNMPPERKGNSYGRFKKSDNPDVVYGRDFEDEIIAIEQIIGEMGEVVVRGKVLSLDTREIRRK